MHSWLCRYQIGVIFVALSNKESETETLGHGWTKAEIQAFWRSAVRKA